MNQLKSMIILRRIISPHSWCLFSAHVQALHLLFWDSLQDRVRYRVISACNTRGKQNVSRVKAGRHWLNAFKMIATAVYMTPRLWISHHVTERGIARWKSLHRFVLCLYSAEHKPDLRLRLQLRRALLIHIILLHLIKFPEALRGWQILGKHSKIQTAVSIWLQLLLKGSFHAPL